MTDQNKDKEAHTALPWEWKQYGQLRGPDRVLVITDPHAALRPMKALANRALVVTACNQHYDLLTERDTLRKNIIDAELEAHGLTKDRDRLKAVNQELVGTLANLTAEMNGLQIAFRNPTVDLGGYKDFLLRWIDKAKTYITTATEKASKP